MPHLDPEESPSGRRGTPTWLQVSNWWAALNLIAAVGGSLVLAMRLITRFSSWDDEGYMLLSLAHYIKDGDLYTSTFSEYGPFYFYAQGIFFQLIGLPVTHDMGRLVTLFWWTTSGVLAAVVVYRLSKNFYLSCLGGFCGMVVGSILSNEPGHPQQIILPLLLLTTLLSTSARPASRMPFFLLGCVGAALAFTKVNVGVFYVAGLAQALVFLLPAGRVRAIGLGLGLLYAASAPWLLMHSRLDQGYWGYLVIATVCSISTFACGTLVLRPSGRLPVEAAVYSGAGFLTCFALVATATSLQGMSASVVSLK